MPARHVRAPLIAECLANIECRVVEIVERHGIVVLEGLAAYRDGARRETRRIHAVGDGTFVADGRRFDRRAAIALEAAGGRVAARGWRGRAPPGRAPGCAYCAVMPPSITSSDPVTQDASSDARNSTPLAMSSAVPSRPIGVRSSSIWRSAGLLKRFSVSGVSA